MRTLIGLGGLITAALAILVSFAGVLVSISARRPSAKAIRLVHRPLVRVIGAFAPRIGGCYEVISIEWTPDIPDTPPGYRRIYTPPRFFALSAEPSSNWVVWEIPANQTTRSGRGTPVPHLCANGRLPSHRDLDQWARWSHGRGAPAIHGSAFLRACYAHQ